MNEYYYLYRYYAFFNKGVVVIIRYITFVLFGLVVFLNVSNLGAIKLVVFLYFLFIVNEMFVNLRVNGMRPQKTVEQVTKETLVDSVFFRPRLAYDRALKGTDLTQKIAAYPENVFIGQKIGVNFSLPALEVSKEEVLAKAYALVKSVKGKYITHLDLFTAYLLLVEKEARVLEAGDMLEQDLINVYYWARNKYEVDDKHKPQEITFYGDGAFDFFIFGWNYELKKYGRSLTSEVMSRKHPPSVIGRAKEYEDFLIALAKPSVSSMILLGDPGTGKTSLVEYFAYNAHLGKSYRHAHVYELLVDRLLAGVESKGDLTERLVYLIAEVSHSGDIILFIQNIENIFGAGGLEFDISGVLYEYLQKNNISLIGTTTRTAYETYIAPKQAASSLFSIIDFKEPDAHTALFMLFEKVGALENMHNVDITYAAVKALVHHANSYLLDRNLPGKALTVLENIVASRSLLGKSRVIDKSTVEQYITGQTRILIGEPTEDEKKLLLELESEMHKRIIGQEVAVQTVASAMRRVRSGFTSGNRPIAVFLFLGPTGVGKTETAKVLSQLYFGSRDAMIRLDMSEYSTPDAVNKLLGEPVGGAYSEYALPEQISRHPFSLLLLDEFEKAHPQIRNLFLQVFDDGRLTDNKGRTVSFQHTIIIATSNAGSEHIRQNTHKLGESSFRGELIDLLLEQQIYTPELINRFDDVIVFTPLTKDDLGEIAALLLQESFAPLADKHIALSFDSSVIEKIVNESFDEQFGARNVRRYITGTIQEYVSQLILQDKLKKGDSAELSVDSAGQFTVR